MQNHLSLNWKRSVCESLEYPEFQNECSVRLPDRLAEEMPDFSGFARYEMVWTVRKKAETILWIEDASEGVEVFVNGKSLGIQIIPAFFYDLTEHLTEGDNSLAIEVATTLERKFYELTKDNPRVKLRGLKVPECESGLNGSVWMFYKESDIITGR